MGAPGTSYWTGSVLVYNTSSRVMSAYLDDDSGAIGFGSYLGEGFSSTRYVTDNLWERAKRWTPRLLIPSENPTAAFV